MFISTLIKHQVSDAAATLLVFFVLIFVNIDSWAGKESQQTSALLLASLIEDEKRPQHAPVDEKRQPIDRNGWALYFDNDLFASPGKDRDYTGGLSLSLSGSHATAHGISIDPFLATLNDWLAIRHDAETTLHGFEFGLTAFTPENIQSRTAVFDDRPYASLVYISNTQQRVNYQNKSSVISSLTLGALGLTLAGEFQKGLHNIVNADKARGWGNQISDGGEFTFRYNVAKQTVHWADYSGAHYNYEIKTAHKLSVGYLSGVSWSVSGRFGKIRTPWSSFNPQNADYAEKALPVTKINSNPKNEFYFWAGLSIHLRAYNAFLQGQFRDSKVTYDSDELNHVVAETWIGVTTELDNGLRLSYFLRGQTSEIKRGPGSRDPVWGGIIVSSSM